MRALAARSLTVNELAEEFEITRRQVYRDLTHLEAEGHPLVQRTDLGEATWQLPLGYKGLPPIAVSPSELMSLHVARAHLSYLAGTPFLEDLDNVIKKIQAGLPAKTTNHLERIIEASMQVARPTRSYGAHKPVLEVLRRALLLQRRVTLHHRTPGYDKPVAHTVDPYVLLLYQHGLYIVGQSHRADSIRLFAVERIKEAKLTDEVFAIPSNFSMAAMERRRFGLIDESPQKVRIAFNKDVAYLLKERQWHPTQALTSGQNGKVEMTFYAGGHDEIAAWILSWGSRAKVIAPQTLVHAVTNELTTALKQYRSRRW